MTWLWEWTLVKWRQLIWEGLSLILCIQLRGVPNWDLSNNVSLCLRNRIQAPGQSCVRPRKARLWKCFTDQPRKRKSILKSLFWVKLYIELVWIWTARTCLNCVCVRLSARGATIARVEHILRFWLCCVDLSFQGRWDSPVMFLQLVTITNY